VRDHDAPATLRWFDASRSRAALAATVIVLGAWVRLTDRAAAPTGGVLRPTPTPRARSGKAWHEMIHRYVAGTLFSIIAVTVAWAVLRRRTGPTVGPVACCSPWSVCRRFVGRADRTLLPKHDRDRHLFGAATSSLWWVVYTPNAYTPRANGDCVPLR